MRTFRIETSVANEAFQGMDGELDPYVLEGALDRWAGEIRRLLDAGALSGRLCDTYGNTVGTWALEEE